MPRGRPRKPKPQLKLAGTFREDRHGGTPDAPAGMPKCPEWVSEAAREHWPEIAEMLRLMNLASPYYSVSLALFVDALADWIAACKEASATPLVSVTDKGNRIQDPIVGIKNKAWQRVLTACREFGMSPSALRGISLPEQPKDELEDLIA